jgi:hypothetical protein
VSAARNQRIRAARKIKRILAQLTPQQLKELEAKLTKEAKDGKD